MLIDRIDTVERVIIIAEIGNNHEGSFDLAQELIGRAKESGADAVKFQTFQAELFGNPRDPARMERLKQFELPQTAFEALAKQARDSGLLFISTPLDLESADFLLPLVDAMKIASGDLTFEPLLRRVSTGDKPVLLSTGLATLDEIRHSVALLSDGLGGDSTAMNRLGILHCVASYPVPQAEVGLANIRTLTQSFDNAIGYSDHFLGIDAAVLAVAAGARIIEKHFTIDREYSDFRDHQLSADPKMMSEMVEGIRHAEVLLGHPEKFVQDCEKLSRISLRRGISAARNLMAGTIITEQDLTWLRPAEGAAPGEEINLIGKSLNKDMEPGEAISIEDVA